MEALAVACRDFSGTIVCASHNRHFLSLVCNELWIVDKGHVNVQIATENNSDLLSSSMSSMSGVSTNSSSQHLQASAALVKATQSSDGSFVGLLTTYLEGIH